MIEDTRQPEFADHSQCDRCGGTFANDDLNELRGDRWYCDDCKESDGREERNAWELIREDISKMETRIDLVNSVYNTLNDDDLNDLYDLLERAWGIVNKLTLSR